MSIREEEGYIGVNMKEHKTRKTSSTIAVKALFQDRENIDKLRYSKFWNNCIGIFKRPYNSNYMKEIISRPKCMENKTSYICDIFGFTDYGKFIIRANKIYTIRTYTHFFKEDTLKSLSIKVRSLKTMV